MVNGNEGQGVLAAGPEPGEPGSEAGRQARLGPSVSITNARVGTSAEMSSRVRRYTITMAFRTACFLAMLLVSGPFRWALLAAAVFLPYVAVILANQANSRDDGKGLREPTPTEAPAITAGEHVEVISGAVVDDEEPRADRVA